MTEKDFLFRIYADGSVIGEDGFAEADHSGDYRDDYRTVGVPVEVVDHLTMGPPEQPLMYEDFDDFKKSVGYTPGTAFQEGWRMARQRMPEQR